MDIIKDSAGFDCSVGETGATPALVQFIGVFAPYSVKGKEGEKLRKEVRARTHSPYSMSERRSPAARRVAAVRCH